MAGGVSNTIQGAGSGPLRLVALTPCRLVDTRGATGAFGGPAIPGGTTRDFVLPFGQCNIPGTALAVSLNVAVVPQGQLGYLTLWPSGQAQPYVATINSDGRVKSNAAIIPMGASGAVSVFASNTTDLVLAVNGFFIPAGGLTPYTQPSFYPLAPCRLFDTRNPNGTFGGPYLTAYQPFQTRRDIPVLSGSCSVPSTAQAYSVNLAAVPHGPLGYLTAYPTGGSPPNTATLNAPTGAVTSNAAVLPAGLDGSISVVASNDTDLIIDSIVTLPRERADCRYTPSHRAA
jgi:hypothetical protein